MDPLSPGSAVLFDAEAGTWLGYCPPRHIVCATRISEVVPALCRVEESVNSENLYAVGFLSYEASPAFDSACEVRPSRGFPLLWFGLYGKPRRFELPKSYLLPPPYTVGKWKPSVAESEYRRAFSRIKKCIGRGETYQVNYSLRLRAPFSGNVWRFFAGLAAGARVGYSAFVNTGRFVVCSASPELFFRLKGRTLVSRPMKGTALRGRFPREDIERMKWLASSEKNRAENVMIVDMIRNDMGKIAETGSVRVDKLFKCERYPTLWQMTSTVRARSRAPVAKIVSALFPCASITGAPKVATMRTISRCETSPRRIYCGCIGSMAPRRKAQFGVAIRTVLIDRKLHRAEYGVGGGIVWPSKAKEEFDECVAKALVLSRPSAEFSLLESILWNPGSGYFLLSQHMKRLKASAAYFDFHIDPASIIKVLAHRARSTGPGQRKVRLLLERSGRVAVGSTVLAPAGTGRCVTLSFARKPVDSSDCFLFHKTTNRGVYADAMASRTEADDVVLWNGRGQITETCTANIVAQLHGRLVTPPVTCGLLAGTFRERLLRRGVISERILTKRDLLAAEKIWVVNSVRRWRSGTLL